LLLCYSAEDKAPVVEKDKVKDKVKDKYKKTTGQSKKAALPPSETQMSQEY